MMNYREELKNRKRIVIKIGTTTITYPTGQLNLRCMEKLAWILTDLNNQGKDVILVSSGAIAVGTDRLNLAERPRDIMGKQAASAVGQAVLMQIYENFFMEYNQKVAQILLTKDVFDNQIKKRNAKNTITTLLDMGVLPIVNENDTVATEELNEFSDNDTLSAYVCDLIEGDLLIILSDIDGLYDANPRENPNAKIIPIVEEVNDDIYKIAGGAGSKLGTGGMITKVKAANITKKTGADMVIASGSDPMVIFDIVNGKEVGTLFKR